MNNVIKDIFYELNMLDFETFCTILCKFNTKMLVENIARYIELSRYGIVVSHNPTISIRSIIKYNRKQRRGLNNITKVIIETPQDRKISVIIYKDGYILIATLKTFDEFTHVINVLTKYLLIEKCIVEHDNKSNIYEFVTNKNEFGIDKICNFKFESIMGHFSYNVPIDINELCIVINERDLSCNRTKNHVVLRSNGQNLIFWKSGLIHFSMAKNIEDINKICQLAKDLLFTQFQKYTKSASINPVE